MTDRENLYLKAKKLCSCMEELLDEQMKEKELNTAQSYMLHYIWNHHRNGTFVTVLHRELGISMATISGTLKKLRKKGFLEVESCPGDERQKKLVPTEKFAMIAETLEDSIAQIENSIYCDLSGEEKNTFLQLENKVLRQAELQISKII